MCGGADYPEPINPREQAAADIMTAREQARIDRELREWELSQQRDKEAQEEQDYTRALGGVRGALTDYATDRFNEYGLDWQEYSPTVNRAIDLASARAPRDADTVGSFLTESIVDDALNRIEGTKRTGYLNQIGDFAPYGFENNYFADTMDDPILNSILDTAYSDALSELDAARNRGELNAPGYESALSRLGSAKTSAYSRLQGIGGGVLGGYRNEVRGIGDTARTNARNWQLGEAFDPSFYRGQITSRTGELGGRLEGDIRGALGESPLFDINSIIGSSARRQGMINSPQVGGMTNSPTGGAASPLLTALNQRNAPSSRTRTEQGGF